jgi:hypothetical protein
MGVVDTVVETITADPTLTAIVVALLLLVFGGYLFLRRIVTRSVQSYQQGKRGS